MLITSREAIPRSLRGAGCLRPARAAGRATRPRRSCTRSTRRCRPARATRILAQAQGNPLGLVELLAPAPAEEEPELPTWLPLTTRLERTFAARVADLPAATRTALLVAALTDRADVTEVLDAASRAPRRRRELEALTPAVDAGLVEVDELRVRFGHPLMRSAIAQGGPEHAAPGGARGAGGDVRGRPARAVWHRVAATAGTDDALADELAAVAQGARAARLDGDARRRRSAAPPR